MFATPALAQAAPVTLSEIQALDDRLGADVRSGDAAAVAAHYASDAVIMPAGDPTATGEAEILAFWKAGMPAIADLRLKAESVRPLGPEYAREIGSYALTLMTPGAPTSSGRYVVIWKKTGASWKLWTDIWNSPAP